MNSIVQFQPTAIDGNRLIESFKRGMSPRTLEAYAGDLEHFGGFCGEAPGMAVSGLLAVSHGQANGLGLAYRASMIEAGLAPATINRRLSAIKSVVKFARTLGLTDWQPEIDGVKSQSYRDTAGPGVDGSRALLKAARDQAVGYDTGSVQIARAKRDVAIIRMLFDMGMRRGELASLDMEHVDLDGRKVWVMGKGKRERIPMTLPIETTKALREWVDTRATICLPHDKPVWQASFREGYLGVCLDGRKTRRDQSSAPWTEARGNYGRSRQDERQHSSSTRIWPAFKAGDDNAV